MRLLLFDISIKELAAIFIQPVLTNKAFWIRMQIG
ncbi:hypothetical protein Syncc8109_2591 [Synechococcus sp. WH 8109]|nr:hypothetical protein Syncc8109_2591 [Synechococcus sp. WH 8109]